MPNVDEHMDDLFRKAADNYPLKTTGSRWDAVQAGLSEASEETAVGTAVRNRKRKYWWLFLFLLAGSGIVYYYGPAKNGLSDTDKPGAAIGPTKNPEKVNTDAIVSEPDLPGTKAAKPAITKVLAAAENNKTGNIFYKGNPVPPGVLLQRSKPQKQSARNFEALFDDAKSRYYIQITPGEIAQTATLNKLKADEKASGNIDDSASTAINNHTAPGKKEDQTFEDSIPHRQQKQIKRPHLYIGAVAGIELNNIKSQQMTKVGFNGGIVAGWRFTSQFAAETGMSISRKNYYSTGKYFNPKQGMMPAGMEVLSLEGSSTILEIPLTLKYNFTTGKKFYVAAGSSSFLLAKEKNNYHAMMSGTPMEMTATYNQESFYPFASLNLGLGFEQPLDKNIFLRIEPYIQVPVKRIGVGQMPVTSTGIHLFITK